MTPAAAFWRRLGLIALAAFALRIAVRLVTGVERYWAEGYTQYGLLGRSLAAGHGYAFPGGPPTAFRVPLYALFVAATAGTSGEAWRLIAAQAAVSAGLVAVAGLTARRLYGPAAGLLAAAWCAAYPYYVWHDLSLQEEGLFAALTATATLVLLALRDNRSHVLALAAGVLLGSAILTRAALAPFALLALGWLLLADGRHALGRRAVGAVLAAAALLAVLSPWLARQHQLTGSAGLGTEFGQSVYAGASPLLFSAFPRQSVDTSRRAIFYTMPPAERADHDRFSRGNPARESRWYAARAGEIAKADPAGYAGRALRKLAIAFGPFPAPRHGLLGDVGYAAWWLPLLGLGLAGAWRDRVHWRRNLLFAAHFAAFAAVTMLVWAQTAHRAYLDVYLMILAAPVLASALPRRWRERLGG
jgi:hypothetical protein